MTFNTGNPIGSTDARDLSDNAENFDKAINSTTGTWNDRLGVTRDTFEGALSKLSFYRVGTFAAGYTLTNMRQTLEYSGHEYSWAGTFPKVVAAGATPATSGGISSTAWVDRTDVTLRSDLGNGVVNIHYFLSSTQIADSNANSPSLDYTDVLNEAFEYCSNNNTRLVIDKNTNIRITRALTSVSNLTLELNGKIVCDMTNISCVYEAGAYFNMFGEGTWDGLNNNIRRFVRSPHVDSQTGYYFRVAGSKAGRIKFKNAVSSTFHRSVDIYDEGVTFEVENVHVDSVSAIANGTIGDLNGSCRGVYVGGSTNGTNRSSGIINDILTSNLLPFEDGDAVHVQSNSSANFDIKVSNIKGYNVAKRVVKVQANGVKVNNVIARAEDNAQSMYAVVSMYGSGELSDVFGVGKIFNGVDAFCSTARLLIKGINIQSTQAENEQQACVTLTGGTVDVDGVYGFGCYYSVFARSISAVADYKVTNINHKAKNYSLRLLQDSAYSFNAIEVSDAFLDSDSTALPSIISAGTIGAVKCKNITANTSYFVGSSFGHTGSLHVSGYSAPNCRSHGIEVLATVTGGDLSDASVGGSAGTVAIVKCPSMKIGNLRGGTYSTLRFDGAVATGNKANGLVTGIGSTRSYEQINGASGNIVTGTFPKVASIIYDAASIASGASLSTIVAVDGAKLGDSVTVSLSSSNLGLNVSGYVSSAGNVTVTFYNLTGAAVDLPSLTVSVKVFD